MMNPQAVHTLGVVLLLCVLAFYEARVVHRERKSRRAIGAHHLKRGGNATKVHI